MLKFVILLVVLTCALGAFVPQGMIPQLEGRIVGGQETTIEKFPYQVSLQRGGRHGCGGSIYNPNTIVTAGHCLRYLTASVIKVRAGSSFHNSGGVLADVSSFQIHEDYNTKSFDNDIAIIRLSTPLVMSATTKAIDLAVTAPLTSAIASVSGWGSTSYWDSSSYPIQLRYVDVEIVGTKDCQSPDFDYGSEVTDKMICTYKVGKDACQRDSGGPLVSDGVLVGVVSWGKGCAFDRKPGVYANVAVLRSWIIEKASVN